MKARITLSLLFALLVASTPARADMLTGLLIDATRAVLTLSLIHIWQRPSAANTCSMSVTTWGVSLSSRRTHCISAGRTVPTRR